MAVSGLAAKKSKPLSVSLYYPFGETLRGFVFKEEISLAVFRNRPSYQLRRYTEAERIYSVQDVFKEQMIISISG